MKTKIVVSIMPKNLNEVSQLKKADFEEADIIEWRADKLLSINSILRVAPLFFEKFSGKSILFTLRTTCEGGQFEIADEEYSQLIKEIYQRYAPDYIDIEYFSRVQILKELNKFLDKIVLSYHNFQEFPKDLPERLKQMANEKTALIKVAVSPRTELEVLEFMQISRRYTNRFETPLISIAMGTPGRLTRISSMLTGSAWTFSCFGQEPSAPGQLTLKETRTVLNILE